MTNEELQKIIDQFDENDLKQQSIFGILQYGRGSAESFIKANKEGLQLFALELLKSARDADNIIADKEKNIIPLDYHQDWIDDNSDVFISYIEPIADKQRTKPKTEYKTTIADKIIPSGCGLVLMVLIVATIVGLITMFKWLF